ncbi:MAG TPA: hypothetical protein VLA00_01855 [Xanthobacteraceae bacterium]|nr:hypothetical protein [Xanthobacteraceae bacterium]
MSKYDALREHLNRLTLQQVPMTFSEIERIIGTRLPPAADAHRAWWSNNPSNNVMTKAWLAAGYRTEEVDMTARRLVFARVPQNPPAAAPPFARAPLPADGDPLAGLHGGLRGTVHLVGAVDLTAPAWSDDADGRRT